MGLLTGILTFPLAPLRTTLWAAEQVLNAAEAEYYDPAPVRQALVELERALLDGRIDEDEYDRREDELLDRLDEITTRRRAPRP
ncbi:gas vesicle protein GvpG [Streptomyces sporangiiformans]|uniref:Gas vesicle protein n=1 Tax=Streptomyces sporangiiformans TaxID=2315329 RepID=A0A505CVN6_9ACTN|nr:gas vesicle protein GvpG [Streptomyces sporangiiformans]TPQ15624.1 gas vesicle protein [Streptomyces sporangiiformans]